MVAATVKLYFLELDNPPLPYVQYEDLKALYKDSDRTSSDEKKVEALKELLLRVPRIHLLVMNALAEHLEHLMVSTRGEKVDADEVYLTKLGLSIGRCEFLMTIRKKLNFGKGLVRPKIDSALTLTDRAPLHFLSDLVRLREQILPSTIEARTQREKDRFTPKRKRTAPVDQRLSRSKLGNDLDATERHSLLEEQMHKKDPSTSKLSEKSELPPTPPPIEKPRLPTPPAPAKEIVLPVASTKAEDAPFLPPAEESEEEPFVEAVSPPSVNGSSIIPAVQLASVVPLVPVELKDEVKPIEQQPIKAVQPEPVAYIPPPATRTSRVAEDLPFIPPSEPLDAPFVPPDEDVPLVAQATLARSGTAEKVAPLARTGRVTRGPRPISTGEAARIP